MINLSQTCLLILGFIMIILLVMMNNRRSYGGTGDEALIRAIRKRVGIRANIFTDEEIEKILNDNVYDVEKVINTMGGPDVGPAAPDSPGAAAGPAAGPDADYSFVPSERHPDQCYPLPGNVVVYNALRVAGGLWGSKQRTGVIMEIILIDKEVSFVILSKSEAMLKSSNLIIDKNVHLSDIYQKSIKREGGEDFNLMISSIKDNNEGPIYDTIPLNAYDRWTADPVYKQYFQPVGDANIRECNNKLEILLGLGESAGPPLGLERDDSSDHDHRYAMKSMGTMLNIDKIKSFINKLVDHPSIVPIGDPFNKRLLGSLNDPYIGREKDIEIINMILYLGSATYTIKLEKKGVNPKYINYAFNRTGIYKIDYLDDKSLRESTIYVKMVYISKYRGGIPQRDKDEFIHRLGNGGEETYGMFIENIHKQRENNTLGMFYGGMAYSMRDYDPRMYYLIIINEDKSLTLIFGPRGTQGDKLYGNAEDWRRNYELGSEIYTVADELTMLSITKRYGLNPKVPEGQLHYTRTLSNSLGEVQTVLNGPFKDYKNNIEDIILVGHSLGAAIVSLLSGYIMNMFKGTKSEMDVMPRIHLAMISSPKSVNKDTKQLLLSMNFKSIISIFNSPDAVYNMPTYDEDVYRQHVEMGIKGNRAVQGTYQYIITPYSIFLAAIGLEKRIVWEHLIQISDIRSRRYNLANTLMGVVDLYDLAETPSNNGLKEHTHFMIYNSDDIKIPIII